MNYLFAFSQFDIYTSTYYAVREDYKIIKSKNWADFFKETKCYCDPLEMACIGEYKKDPYAEIYTNRHYSKPFIINGNHESITVLKEDDIDYYHEVVDPETRYYNAVATCMERD